MQPSETSFIQDIAYDYYGKRLVTVSIGRDICIWSKKQGTEDWQCTCKWKGHEGPILSASWAHPSFGSLIATGSYDRRVIVWEESDTCGSSSFHETGQGWCALAHLVDAREEVRQVQFAPPHLGLIFASGSADGFIRIYSCLDMADLHQWPLVVELDAESPVTSLCWNPSTDSPAVLAVASYRDCRIWQLDKEKKSWETKYLLCTWERFSSDSRATKEEEESFFCSVAWAPHVGRSYELIAVGCFDGTVLIFKLPRMSDNKKDKNQAVEEKFTPIAVLHHGQQKISRLQWNVVGSILASSGEDSEIRLWKAVPSDLKIWNCFDTVHADEQEGMMKLEYS
eukprot:jgi/Galph1/5620/GphlegSOOS_G4258.1